MISSAADTSVNASRNLAPRVERGSSRILTKLGLSSSSVVWLLFSSGFGSGTTSPSTVHPNSMPSSTPFWLTSPDAIAADSGRKDCVANSHSSPSLMQSPSVSWLNGSPPSRNSILLSRPSPSGSSDCSDNAVPATLALSLSRPWISSHMSGRVSPSVSVRSSTRSQSSLNDARNCEAMD